MISDQYFNRLNVLQMGFVLDKLLERKYFQECEAICTAALKKDHLNSFYHGFLGIIYLEKNDINTAVHHLKKSYSIDPENYNITKRIFKLYLDSCQNDTYLNLLIEFNPIFKSGYNYFYPDLNTDIANEFLQFSSNYPHKRIFTELKKLFNQLTYSPVWNEYPDKIEEWKNSIYPSSIFSWFENNTINIIPEFYNFLRTKTSSSTSLKISDIFKIINKGLLDISAILNTNNYGFEKRNIDSKVTKQCWEKNILKTENRKLFKRFEEFIENCNISSVLLHGSISDGNIEKGFSDFDVTFIIDIPNNYESDDLFQTAENILKSNAFLLLFNPFMHHGPIVNFTDELNWSNEVNFPSILVKKGVWLKNPISQVFYKNDILDAVTSFSAFDQFFTIKFNNYTEFKTPFDIIWWTSSILFLPLLITQMHIEKSVWKRDLLNQKNKYVPKKFWEFIDSISEIRRKAALLIQNKQSTYNDDLDYDYNPGLIKKKAILDLAVSSSEIQSIGITNETIKKAKDFWNYCKISSFNFFLERKNSKMNSVEKYLENWPKEIIEIPELKGVSIYNETREYFIDLCKSNQFILSVYEFGNVGCPGLSDLDFLVVLKDDFQGEPEELKIVNMKKKYAEILSHDPLFISESSAEVIGSVFPLFNCKKNYGNTQKILLTQEFSEDVKLPLFTFLNLLKYPNDLLVLAKQDKVRWKTLLAYLNSFNHIINCFNSLNIPIPDSIIECSDYNKKIRNNFQNENFTEIDDLKIILLKMIEASADMVIAFEFKWVEILPELKDIYGMTNKEKYLSELLNSLVNSEISNPQLPPILDTIMLYLQKNDDKIDINSMLSDNINSSLKNFINNRLKFFLNEIKNGRLPNYYILGNRFNTKLSSDEIKQYSLGSVNELRGSQFKYFMIQLNLFAHQYSLRKMLDWSKVWEYPWIWYNAINQYNFKGLKIVDLGSELSPLPWVLATKGAEITLIETNNKFIPVWEQLNKQLNVNVKWHIVNNEIIPLPDNSADLLTSFSVIEHQPDKYKAVDEVIRVLKPNGVFALSFDICESEMGMTFPEWNGKALTLDEFEKTVWKNESFQNKNSLIWNLSDIPDFWLWHQKSAPHHNYVTAAAKLVNKKHLVKQNTISENKASFFLNEKKVREILYVRTDAIGDNILSLPLLAELSKKYKHAKFTIVCQENVSDLYKHYDFIRRIISYNKLKISVNEEYRTEIFASLSLQKYDIVINPVFSSEEITDLFSFATESKIVVKIDGDNTNCPADWLQEAKNKADLVVGIESSAKNELEKYQSFLKAFDINSAELHPNIIIDKESENFAKEFFNTFIKNNELTIALFPFANHFHKEFQNFEQLIQSFSNYNFIILGGKEKIALSERFNNYKNCFNLVGRTNLLELAAIMKKCNLYVGADSSGAHIACSQKIPNIVILGGGHFGRFFPYSKYTSVVCKPMNCYGCNWNCIYENTRCVNEINPELLTYAIVETLKKDSDLPRVFYSETSTEDISILRKYLDEKNCKFVVNKSAVNDNKIEDLILSGNYNSAFGELQKMIQKDPLNLEALNNLSVVYAMKGNKGLALKTIEKILEIEPCNSIANENLKSLQ